MLAALAGADKGGARALVSDLLSIAGISSVGGRTTGEIAERFLEQSAARATGGAPQEKRDLIARYNVKTPSTETAIRDLSGGTCFGTG